MMHLHEYLAMQSNKHMHLIKPEQCTLNYLWAATSLCMCMNFKMLHKFIDYYMRGGALILVDRQTL